MSCVFAGRDRQREREREARLHFPVLCCYYCGCCWCGGGGSRCMDEVDGGWMTLMMCCCHHPVTYIHTHTPSFLSCKHGIAPARGAHTSQEHKGTGTSAFAFPDDDDGQSRRLL